jgi:tellurite resistance protein
VSSRPITVPPPFAKLENDELAAFIEVMVLAASADGDFAPEERSKLAASFESLTSRSLDAALIDEVTERLSAEVGEQGRASRLASLGARLPEPAARRIAFDLALQVVLADGVVRTSERELLLEVAEALGIDPEEAADAVKKRVAELG